MDRFEKRSAAEMERDFPAMVRAGSPVHMDLDAVQQLPVGELTHRHRAHAACKPQYASSLLPIPATYAA